MFTVSKVFWVVARLGGSYAVTRVFWVVVRVLLCSCYVVRVLICSF